MAKKVKIGGKSTFDRLDVEIKGVTHSVPLPGSMKRKELLALKDEDGVEEMFARYIPKDVLEDLTLNEYTQLANAWIDEYKDKNDSDLGES